jgi:hypothetical protein
MQDEVPLTIFWEQLRSNPPAVTFQQDAIDYEIAVSGWLVLILFGTDVTNARSMNSHLSRKQQQTLQENTMLLSKASNTTVQSTPT